MTIDQLIEACVHLSVRTSYTTKDGQHDLTDAVLQLQICLEEIQTKKRKTKEINDILAAI